MRSIPVAQWQFRLGDEPEAWQKGFDDSAWRTVTVPHDWSIEQDFSREHSSGTGYLPGGIGWYRAHLPARSLVELVEPRPASLVELVETPPPSLVEPSPSLVELVEPPPPSLVELVETHPPSLVETRPASLVELVETRSPSLVELVETHRVRLVFHGVYKNADVWVNGYHLGSRPSGYAEFGFDLTELLGYAPDAELVVSVRVEHTDIADSRWYNGTGITRGVELEVHELVGLAEYGTSFVTEAVDPDGAHVTIASRVLSRVDASGVEVHHELTSLATGASHSFAGTVDVAAGVPSTLVVTGVVANPELWSDTSPTLYRLTTTLGGGSYTEVVGIRTFGFDPDTGFSINGEPRTLRGVCLHEDAGPFGTAVPAAVWLRRLLTLQTLGCNAVRMAHNPHSPELYRLCDVLGLFVIDEAFDEWESPKNKWWQGHNVYPPRHQGYAKDFPNWHQRDLVNMVDAHRNHPSIIAWSIGNEIDYPNDPYASPLFETMTGNNDKSKPASERVYDPNRPDIRRLTTIAGELIDLVKAADPTRPVTLAAAFPELSRLTGLLDRLDLIGYNYKEHLYADDHRHLPQQPLVGSENSHGYPQWRAVTDNDYIAGQFLWTGIDYLGETRGWPSHGSSAGLLTLAGLPKPVAELRRSWWSDEPVVHLVTRPASDDPERNLPHGNFWSNPVSRTWEPGQPVEVLCFSNCDELLLTSGGVELPLSWDAGHGYWWAIATPGAEPLRVEGYKSGAVVTDVLGPRGAPSALDARVWTAAPGLAELCAAAGVDVDGLLQVELTLLDADGNPAAGEVPITAEVEGGTLLGLESGNLDDNTRYTAATRSTHGGRLVVFVAGSERAVVRLRTPGLPEIVVEGRAAALAAVGSAYDERTVSGDVP